MHERQTPANLLAGRPWACWGPPVERAHLSDAVLLRIARRVHRPVDEVAALLHEDDQPRGRYLLLEQLSVTKHAAVYAGFDPVLARDVVVKIHRDRQEHATAQALFESRAMAQLDQHPNICRIYDVGEHREHLYTVVERCEADLADWHLGRDCAAITMRIVETAAALQWLHELGYAHGDVKPSNIFIRNGAAKLGDFGHSVKSGTRSEFKGGTVGFVAPECFETGPTPASDVFALAVTLWVCLIGELPYPKPEGEVSTRTAVGTIWERMAKYELAEPKTLPPGLPAGVMPALRDALHPNWRLRPSMDQLNGRLYMAVESEQRRRRRRRVGPAVAGVALVVAGIGFSCGLRYSADGAQGDELFSAAVGIVNPLAHAEAAAHRGDVDTAMGALYRIDIRITDLSPSESFSAGRSAERIAEMLEQEHTQDAIQAAYFAVRLYEHATRFQDAQRVRETFKIPVQNK